MAGSSITSSLTIKLIDDISGPAKTVAKALKLAEQQAKEIGKALEQAGVSSRLGEQLRRLGASAGDIRAVGDAWKRYAAEAKLAAQASDWTKGQASSVLAWERQTVGALKNVQREEQAFARAQQRMRDAQQRMRDRAGLFGRIGGTVAEGAGGFAMGMGLPAVGGAIATGIVVKDAIEAGANRQHEIVRMRAAGMSTKEIAEALASAGRLSEKFPAISGTDALHMLRNARSIVGSYEEAEKLMEPLARLRIVATLARPGVDVAEDFDQLLKGIEIKGATQNPKKFREYMQGIAKGLNAFGDTLRPYQYYEMFKYGRQATQGLSEKFILKTAPTLAQEFGGSSYGQAVSGFNAAVVSGIMKHTAALGFAKLGLIGGKDIVRTKTGSIKGLRPGAGIKEWRLAQSDPFDWVNTVLLPSFKKAGITEPADISKKIGELFQNKVVAQFVNTLATQQSRILKDWKMLEGTGGLETADIAMKTDPKLAWEGLKNSLDNLGAAASRSVDIASLLDNLAGGINSFANSLEVARAKQDAEDLRPSPGQLKANAWLDYIFGKGPPEAPPSPYGTLAPVPSPNTPMPPPRPYGTLAPIAPQVDTSSATNAGAVADQAKMSFEQLGSVSVAPNVNTASLDAAIGKARELEAIFARLGSLAAHVGAGISADTTAAARLKAAMGNTQRGRFATGGVQGE